MFERVREWWNGRPDPVRKNNKSGTYTVTYQLGEPDYPWIRRFFRKHKKITVVLFFALLIPFISAIGSNLGNLPFNS